jgi:hypothetical protein
MHSCLVWVVGNRFSRFEALIMLGHHVELFYFYVKSAGKGGK